MSTDENLALQARLDDFDQAIRRGAVAEVREQLKVVLRANPPRAFRVRLANLARRVGLPMASLRLLAPIVRPEDRKNVTEPATQDEILEYAAALAYIGAQGEALELLHEPAEKRVSQALFFSALAHMSVWDYAAATLDLRHYVASADLSPYQKMLGELNLAASLIYERQYLEARDLLMALVEGFRKESYLLLQASAHELLAQIHYYLGELGEADQQLDQTSTLNPSSREGLFAKKWRAIVKLAKPASAEEGRLELGRIGAEAHTQSQWEVARDCDYRLALSTGSRDLFLKLYAGSPHKSYRERIAAGATQTLNQSFAPYDYLWQPLGAGSAALKNGPSIDLGELDPKLPNALLKLLLSDLYAPFRIAALHAGLHPQSYFNPRSSPATIHQILKRLREDLAAQALPIEVCRRGSGYTLEAQAPVRVRIPLVEERRSKERSSPELQSLLQHFSEKPFALAEAVKHLGMPKRSAQRLIAQAVSNGRLATAGQGRALRYKKAA